MELLDIINEELQEERFVIDNDAKAEWALKKIAEERAETQRYVNVCDTMIAEYEYKKRIAQAKLDTRTGFLQAQLYDYFNTVEHKKSATQETYKLPSGTLKLKYPKPTITRDEDMLIAYLWENHTDLVQVEYKSKWGEFKKALKVQGDKVIDTSTGEIVEGLGVQENAPEFVVEI